MSDLFTMYTKEEKQREIEANLFACALLMPKEQFVKILQEYKEINEEERLVKTANIFKVPLFAVVMRIQMLTNRTN